VLLVEDNPADALLVREAIVLEGLPLEIHFAEDGEIAISFIERAENDPNAPSPDLVLLDINLPRIDGFDVLRRIRASERYGRLPVIVLSSSDSPADQREAARFGASYFRKFRDYSEFLKIGPALRRFLEENALLR
jgi:CheY-like chemotaxis protein